jgi:hypothetical protein
LHYSGETFRELPANWRGYLPDHRTLRMVAAPQLATGAPSPLRDTYTDAALKLEAAAKSRQLTADETADLGALYVRLGQPQKALAVLRPAARQHQDHFRLAANLGTAWQLVGDLDQAALALEDAARLAPEKWKAAEALHLKLVRLRLKETKAAKDLPDELFEAKPPAEAVSLTQLLALWLPADGRLLWQLGELAHKHGDVRTAASILDGCVTEFAMGSPELRARRQKYRSQADDLDTKQGHDPARGTIAFKSPRALTRTFDPARLPPIRDDADNVLPWPVVGETEIGPKGKATFLKYAEQLDGKRVTLLGYMAPTNKGDETVASFLLTEYPIGCWFCESPGPTQIVLIGLAEGKAVEPTRNVVKIHGTLKLNRTDPERFPFAIVDATVRQAD